MASSVLPELLQRINDSVKKRISNSAAADPPRIATSMETKQKQTEIDAALMKNVLSQYDNFYQLLKKRSGGELKLACSLCQDKLYISPAGAPAKGKIMVKYLSTYGTVQKKAERLIYRGHVHTMADFNALLATPPPTQAAGTHGRRWMHT